MLIAVSGSQGSGKSVLLQQIKDNGYNIIERKTSRSILTDWNVSLQQINNDHEWTTKFQNEIIKRKFDDEMHALNDPYNVYFTERTYADLMVYFLLATGGNNIMSDTLKDYFKQCIKYQQKYSKVFYLKAGHFVPEHDGVRGSNIHYSRVVDLVMLDMTQQMTSPDKLIVVDTPCLEQRLNIILAHSVFN